MEYNLGPGLDLSGKLIIKVQLGDDIRLIPIHNEDITYDELVLMMQRVYRGKLSTNDDIVIKYKDEDGDLITIFDSSDLTFAIQCSRILKITLFVNGKQPSSVGDVRSLRRELQKIRDSINAVLDHTESGSPVSSSVETAMPAVTSEDHVASRPGEGKEFDPLTMQRSFSHDGVPQNKASSFAVNSGEVSSTASPGTAAMTERTGAATPDSLSSIGSSASHRQQQLQQQQQQQQQQPQQPGSVNGGASYAAAAAVSHQGYGGQVTGSYAPSAATAGQGGQPSAQPTPAQYQPSPGAAPPSSQPTPAQGSQYGHASMPAAQHAQTPGQFAQGAAPAGMPGQQAPPSSQAYPGYAQPGQAGYGQYAPGLAQPGQPQQGLYGQGAAAVPGTGPPQPQPQPASAGHQQQPPQQAGYPSGTWNMQAPGQQKMGGAFPPTPPGPGQPPAGSAPPAAGHNPYSRAPGYGAPYPRPPTNYQQGYQ